MSTYELLCERYPDIIKTCVVEYVINKKDIESENFLRQPRNSYLFFRTFYYYYVIIKYILLVEDTLDTPDTFLKYINYSMKRNKGINFEAMYNLFEKNYEYLHDTIPTNVYFSTYFNNLIKYVLPIPHELFEYSPVITYRNNVDKFYKKNNIDYLDTIKNIDTTKQGSYVKPKNVDMVRNEIDIHIPMKYFDSKLFSKNIFIIGCSDKLYIANGIDGDTYKVTYMRDNREINEKKFRDGYCLELLMDEWKAVHKKININKSSIVYLCVMRKLTPDDLYNVFPRIDLKNDKVFHNTGLEADENVLNTLLEIPTFFYTKMMGNNIYITGGRKCVTYDVYNPIVDIIDLTRSVATNNPFVRVVDDTPCIAEYGLIQSIEDFVKMRPECDLGRQNFYVGRRKLQEILYKTRKYSSSHIWIHEHFVDRFEGVNKPLHSNIYYSPNKLQYKLTITDYDSILLRDMNMNGFLFTDFGAVWDKGGELMLTHPNNFLRVNNVQNSPCYTLEPGYKQKYAYVSLLTGTNKYVHGALATGCSLMKTSTSFDIVIMVTPDVDEKICAILEKIYKVIKIDFMKIDTNIIANHDKSRFRDVFTKLQALKLVQYEKILLHDIDLLFIKNVDDLFDLITPAAMIRHHILRHGQRVDKKLIMRNGKQIGGINAGVMLLRPDMNEYNAIEKDLQHANRRQYKNPEQDYLSVRYANKWINIGYQYNFQFGLTAKYGMNKNTDVKVIHYSSWIKPWLALTEDISIELMKRGYDKSYYELWMNTYDQCMKNLNITFDDINIMTGGGLIYDDKLNKYITNEIKHIIIGNDYKIGGSFGRVKYITDIDITNNVPREGLYDKIINIINNLPNNIKFLYASIGSKHNIGDLVDVNDSGDIVVKFDTNLQGCELLKSLRTGKMRWLYDDIVKGEKYMDDDYSNKYDINSAIDNGNIPPIMHFLIDYDDSFVIADVALKYTNITPIHQLNYGEIMKYCNKEYFYILKDIGKYTKNNNMRREINSIINEKYGNFKQIMMQIYYIKFMIEHNINSGDTIHKYIKHVLKEAAIYNSKIDDNDDDLTMLNKLENYIYEYVNKSLKDVTMKFIKKVNWKSKYMKYLDS